MGFGDSVEPLAVAPGGAFVKINDERHYSWRAVDHEGELLESFVKKPCEKKALLKILKKILKRHCRGGINHD